MSKTEKGGWHLSLKGASHLLRDLSVHGHDDGAGDGVQTELIEVVEIDGRAPLLGERAQVDVDPIAVDGDAGRQRVEQPQYWSGEHHQAGCFQSEHQDGERWEIGLALHGKHDLYAWHERRRSDAQAHDESITGFRRDVQLGDWR